MPTPGPWHINTAGGRLPVVREIKMPHGEASHYRSSVQGDSEHVCVIDFGYGKGTDEANARLISAAPDLLKAAKDSLCGIPDRSPIRQILIDAIAKAEGQ